MPGHTTSFHTLFCPTRHTLFLGYLPCSTHHTSKPSSKATFSGSPPRPHPWPPPRKSGLSLLCERVMEAPALQENLDTSSQDCMKAYLRCQPVRCLTQEDEPKTLFWEWAETPPAGNERRRKAVPGKRKPSGKRESKPGPSEGGLGISGPKLRSRTEQKNAAVSENKTAARASGSSGQSELKKRQRMQTLLRTSETQSS